ncbi:tRNA adenosine(34) deaminase TadA [Agaribacter flavus]|uniref:tRNA-specific adenosine deaminase n=1 Tax=Agaribacter flavus TaxID=1902781 RepID=A0ABV7FQE2_9ALTE
MKSHVDYMRLALEQARIAEQKNEVPVGAVVVVNDQVIGVGHNQSIATHDPSAHAEMMAIREAGKVLANYRMVDASLYVTLEPCPMCAGLLVHSRIRQLIFGAYDTKTGACGSVMNICNSPLLNHQVEVLGGVLEGECSETISKFFTRRRKEIKASKQLKNG